MYRGKDETPPAPVGPFILPNLRHFHLNNWCDQDVIFTIGGTLSLPCLTSLSLELHERSSAPLPSKGLLRRVTYLKIKGRYLFQAMEFPLLHIFQFDGDRNPQGTLLSECPNLPIQQIDILILALPRFSCHFSSGRFYEWCAGVHCILTEACDPALMPKLKRAILEERLTTRIVPKDLYPSYRDLVSCYGPLADVFESRGVELSLRMQVGIRVMDVPVRDFILQMESCFPSSPSSTKT